MHIRSIQPSIAIKSLWVCWSLLFFFGIPLQALATDRSIAWNEDYEAAVQQSAATNRVLLLHFYTDNCPPCRLLERKTFHDPSLIDAFQQNLIPTRINAEKRRDLATKYNITRWPTDVYLFPNGDEIYRGVSDQDPAVYTTKIKRIALRHRDWSVEQEAIAKTTQRRQDQMLAAHTPQIHSDKPVYAGTSGHAVKSQSASWSQPQPSTVPNAALQSPAPKRIIDNPFIAQQPVQVPASSPTSVSNKATPASPVATSAPRSSFNPEVTVPIPATSPVVEKKTVPVQPVSMQHGATSIVEHSSSSSINESLTPRPDQQPTENKAKFVMAETIGMGGFCPVSLIESIQQSSGAAWIAGSPSFAVRHRGRIYYCASDNARKVLLSDPDRFTPGLSGFDLVHFFKTGELHDGSCKFGCIQPNSNRIFLFESQANYQEFEREMDYYTRLLDRVTPERVANRSVETSLR